MPTLNWIGKEKVVSRHLDMPFRVLEQMAAEMQLLFSLMRANVVKLQ